MMLSNTPYLKTSAARALAALVMLLASAWAPFIPAARAQIVSTISHRRSDLVNTGFDYWLVEMSNDWGENLGGKYMRIYLSAPYNTTAYVESNGTVTPVPVNANQVASFAVPEFWEVESSGIVENKAIHIYSKAGDLTVCSLSHSAYGSDGSSLIPTGFWGTDYVVSAYNSLFEGFDSSTYDEPSTCAIVATIDSSIVQITPSCDCRKDSAGSLAGDSLSSVVAFHAGQTYSFRLDRGQSLELMPVKASDGVHFDLTGTIIHANVPIGVFGGSSVTNIPSNFGYASHVEEMLPAVREWGTTYYATNPPDTTRNHNFAQYLLIGSEPSQIIYRENCLTGKAVECVLANKHDFYWDELSGAQKFSSDAPFSVTEYSNSSTFPDTVRGTVTPSEVTIQPRSLFSNMVLFLAAEGPPGYTTYVQVAANKNDVSNLKLDGNPISNYTSECLDSNWEILTLSNVSPKAHTLSGANFGVGVTVFCEGLNDTYSWSSVGLINPLEVPDSIPPVADAMSNGLSAFVHVTDSGLLPGGIHSQTGIWAIGIDSVSNMLVQIDSDFIPDLGVDTSGYAMSVINPKQSAYLRVSAYDGLINATDIVSTYTAPNSSVSDLSTPLPAVFPEPDGSVRIVSSDGPAKFELLNILGQAVYTATVSGTETVNTSALPPGIYFYRLTSASNSESGKILLGN